MFGGGRLDHAIYFVDLLRWLSDDEFEGIRGRISNLQHKTEPLEDYGDAQMRMWRGGMVHLECGWTVTDGTGILRELHITGVNGQAVWTTRGSLGVGGLEVTQRSPGGSGWVTPDLRAARVVPVVEHAIAVLRGEAEVVASVHDARANLEACLAFYERAERV